MEWLYGLGAATGLGLLGWILIEVIGVKVKLAAYDMQINRLVSDADSEKHNHRDKHSEFDRRLAVLERGRQK
jgi:hypothetical protein